MKGFFSHFFIESLNASIVFIFTKIVGIWLALWITGEPYTFQPVQGLFTTTKLVLTDVNSVFLVNGVANIFVLIVSIVIAFIILTRSIYLNELNQTPRIVVKIIYLNLHTWMEDGKKMYPRLMAWGMYLWLVTIILFRDSTVGISWNIVSILSLIVSITYTAITFNFLDKHINHVISFTKSYDKKF